MYPFCITYPYGFLVLLGGLIGFATAGSTTSLAAGCGSGAALLILAKLSVDQYNAGKNQRLLTAISLAISTVLTGVMRMRWDKTGKYMPAGFVFHLSAAVTVFYVFSFLRSDIKPKANKAE